MNFDERVETGKYSVTMFFPSSVWMTMNKRAGFSPNQANGVGCWLVAGLDGKGEVEGPEGD